MAGEEASSTDKARLQALGIRRILVVGSYLMGSDSEQESNGLYLEKLFPADFKCPWGITKSAALALKESICR